MWIAIDLAYKAGKPIAYAGIDGNTEEVIFVTSTRSTGDDGIKEVQAYVRDALRYGQIIEGIVVERAYHSRNLEVFRRFSQMCGRIQQFCIALNIRYAQVMPAHWKGSYLRNTGIKARSKQADAYLDTIAHAFIGHYHFSDDERDAVLMGLYFCRRERDVK